MARDRAPGSADLTPGTTLSNTYEIIEYLALGGMAEVYRARNIHTDEPVAIKVVLPEFARDETRLALFRKEATVLSRLHHEAIVHYHMFTVEKETNRPYLVMEFVEGHPAQRTAEAGPARRDERQGADPPRRLGPQRRPRARRRPPRPLARQRRPARRRMSARPRSSTSASPRIPAAGTLLGGKFAGKYNFVSPEQLGLYGGDITGQSDIYSLGLIAIAALRGEELDMGGTHAEVIDKRRAVPDLSGIDESIRPVIAAMLAPDPAVRPKTMQEVVDLLAAPPAPTAKPMPGPASDDPWGEPTPAKPAAGATPWDASGCGRRHRDRAASARPAANEHADAAGSRRGDRYHGRAGWRRPLGRCGREPVRRLCSAAGQSSAIPGAEPPTSAGCPRSTEAGPSRRWWGADRRYRRPDPPRRGRRVRLHPELVRTSRPCTNR